MGISLDEVRALLDYNPETGLFHWKSRRGVCDRTGQLAGSKAKSGYIDIRVGKVRFYGHRLAWFYCHGKHPERFIDHINGDKSDNRIENLREANKSQNNWNMKPRACGSNKYKGVHLEAQTGKWRASIGCLGKQYKLGPL
jgi:hypothetical protein